MQLPAICKSLKFNCSQFEWNNYFDLPPYSKIETIQCLNFFQED